MQEIVNGRHIPPMKPTTLLLWCVVVIGTSLLAHVDFGQLGGASKSNPQQNPLPVGAATQKVNIETTQKSEPVSNQCGQPKSEPVSNQCGQPNSRKQQTKATPNAFDPPFQIATNYFPQGGIGLRWSQNFYENPLDLGFQDGLEHLEESKTRRLINLHEQVNALQKPDYDQPDLFPEFRANHTSPIYLSHIYYKTKWNTVDQESQALASAQNGYVSDATGQCAAPAEVSDDMDLSKKRIMSNRVKMGLMEIGTRPDEKKILRQSALLSYAFGWYPSCELPIDRIERNENEQIIEATFSKMARTHHSQNYAKFVKIFSAQEMSGSRNLFSRSFYTVDHGNNHPATKPGGIIDGIYAKDISNLTKSKNPRAATFFGQRVEIQPNFINFNQVQILRPEQIKFTIENIDTETDIIINDMLTSSPEILIYPPKGLTFPITMTAGSKLTFNCLIAPETWGLNHGSVTVAFDSEFMFMIPVTAFGISNEYEIEPVYYSNVNVGESVIGQLKLKNPSATEELEILELYSTEDYLKLFWPNQVQVASVSEAQSSRDFSKYLKIEAGAKAKTILTFKFETDQVVDHHVVIHILTSRGDVLRIPFYFHVYPDQVKFTPSIIDFGLVPFRFDLLKIPVSVNIRNGIDFSVLYLSEVLLPINDKRLDFMIGAWDRESYGNIQVINKNTRRLEEQRRGVVQRDKSLHLFTIILNPMEFGPVDTNVVLVFNQEDGTEFRIDLPIIGHVLPTSNLLTENGLKSGNHFQPWSTAKPAISIDVSHQLVDPTINIGQILKSKRVEERLILANTLGLPIKGFEVVNTLPDSVFTYFSGSSSKQHVSSKSGVISPGQTIQLGAFVLNIKDLKTTSGRYYSFIHVNGNIFLPIAIQVTDNRLLCSYQPDDYKTLKYQDCSSSLALDFGNLVPYHPKDKIVNMTNTGSEPVQIDWLIRTQLDIQVRFLKHDPPISPTSATLGSVGEQYSEELKTRIGIWIQPQQTLVMQITVEPTQRTLQGSSEMAWQQLLTFQYIPRAYSPLEILVNFRVYDGTIQFLPKNNLMSFRPAHLGQEEYETQVLNFKSRLKKDVLVKSISVDDPRFKISITNTKLINETEVLKVQFDPNQKPVAPSVAVSVKNQTDMSKILQRVTNQDQSVTQNTQKDPQNDFQPISVKDMTKLRFQQEQLFKNRKISDSKIVEATLTVETDFSSPIKVKLIGVIQQPELINTTKIDFGQIALGSSVAAPLIIKNPFNETMKVQIYLGRTTVQMENELRKLKLMSITEDPDLNENIESDKPKSNRLADKLMRDMPYANSYCLKQITISKENNVLAASTPETKRKWYYDENWLSEYEDAVFLDRESPKDIICAGIMKALSRYESKEEFQNDNWLWDGIDKFFREQLMLNLSINTDKDPQANIGYDQLGSMGILSQQFEAIIDTLVKGNDQVIQFDQQTRAVDQEMLDDLISCSVQLPLLETNPWGWYFLTQHIAFPNVLDHYIPVRPFLRYCYWLALSPVRWLQSIIQTASKQEGIINQISTVFSEAIGSVFNVFQSSITSRKKSRGIRPEDFLLQRARDKNFQPAATISNQFQFNNEALHENILRNNGTIGIERNTQNFFLNTRYHRSFSIPPLKVSFFPDVILFEPHALTTGDEQLQMNLYIKTDKTSLQKIELVGKSSSPVLELTNIEKIVNNQQEGKNFQHMKLEDLPMFCSVESHQPDCIDAKQHSYLVAQQLLGKSSLTPLITLKIDLSDIMQTPVDEPQRELPSAFSKLLSEVSWSETKPIINEIPRLVKRFDWRMTFSNIGNADFDFVQFGFEDPVSGEISCQSGEMYIEPCTEIKLQPLKKTTFNIYLKADYSTVVYKKTLVFKSVGHIQRFPLHLYTDAKILDYANNIKDASHQIQRWAVLLIGLSLLAMTELNRKGYKHRQQKRVLIPDQNETQLTTQHVNAPEQIQDPVKVQTVQEVTVQSKKPTNQASQEQQKQISSSSVKKQKLASEQPPVTRPNLHKVPTSQIVEEENKEEIFIPVVQPKVIDQYPVQIDLPLKTKKQADQIQVQPISVVPIPTVEVKTEKLIKESFIRTSKKDKRIQELKRRETEILASPQVSEQEQQALNKESDPVSMIEKFSQEKNKHSNQVFTETTIPNSEIQQLQDNYETDQVEVEVIEQNFKNQPLDTQQIEERAINQHVSQWEKHIDEAAPPVKQSEIQADSPRPLREEIKNTITEQVEFQVPSKLKKSEANDQLKYYKKVEYTSKASAQDQTIEVDKPRAKLGVPKAGQLRNVYQPSKIYQRAVTSVERAPLTTFVERHSSQAPANAKQEPVAQTPHVTTVLAAPTRVVVDNTQDNYFDRNNQLEQLSSQQTTSQQQRVNQQFGYTQQEYKEINERKQAPHQPLKVSSNLGRPRKEEHQHQQWYYQEAQKEPGSQQYQRVNPGHAYYRNKQQPDQWQTNYDQQQEDQYNQEHDDNEENDDSDQSLPYHQHSKIPHWQQNHEDTPRPKPQTSLYAPPTFQKIYPQKPQQERPVFVQKPVYQYAQPIYQPKKQEFIVKPVQEPQVNQNKSIFADSSQEEKPYFIEPIEETKQVPETIPVKKPEEEQKANNFYNAFKSISSILSKPKKQMIQDDDNESVETFIQYDQNTKRTTPFPSQSSFSLFNNSVFAKDVQANLSNPSSFDFQSHQRSEMTARPQLELFNSSTHRNTEPPVLAFQPLKQYNNVWADSLNSLTNPKKQNPKDDDTMNSEEQRRKFM